MAKKSKDEDVKKKKKKKTGTDLVAVDVKKKKKKDKFKDVVKADVSGGKAVEKSEKKPREDRQQLPVEKDDYIVVKVGNKHKLCFAHNPKRNTAYLEETMQSDEPQTIEYDAFTLIANLGQKPAPGKAYGVTVEPYFGDGSSEIGQLFFYRELDDEEKKAVRIGCKKAAKLMIDSGLSGILPIGRIEIRPPQGKWAGKYVISFKSGEAEDKILLHPKILNDQLHNVYIFAHELGHAVWYRMVPERMRSEWLLLFNEHTKVERAKKQEMEDQFHALAASQLSVREYMRDIEEEELAMFREALAYLKKHHKMTPEDVNVLLNNNSKALGKIWPSSAAISNSEPLVSEYAMTCVQELFAEAFAYHMTGRDIGKTVKKLLERTLKEAKSNFASK